MLDDDGEVFVGLGQRGAEGRGGLVDDVIDDVGEGAGHVVGHAAGEQFVQDDAQGVDVGAGVDGVGLAAELLGGGVGEGAGELALAGDGGGGSGARRDGTVGVGRVVELGDAEVDDARAAVGVDEDVGGLEVAVDDAPLVGVVHGVDDLQEELDDGGDAGPWREVRERLAPLVERAALDVLHHQREATALDGHAVVHGDDVGVAELRGDLGLALEAGPLATGGKGPLQEHLHGHVAAGAFLRGEVDHALCAAVEFAAEGVPGHFLLGGKWVLEEVLAGAQLALELAEEALVLPHLLDDRAASLARRHVRGDGDVATLCRQSEGLERRRAWAVVGGGLVCVGGHAARRGGQSSL